MEEACDISNRIAPEHLEISSREPHRWEPLLKTRAPSSWGLHQRILGDYCAGPNHVLPTSGTARFSSPLGVYDFQRSSGGSASAGPIAATLAYGEGLQAHAQAAELRSRRAGGGRAVRGMRLPVLHPAQAQGCGAVGTGIQHGRALQGEALARLQEKVFAVSLLRQPEAA